MEPVDPSKAVVYDLAGNSFPVAVPTEAEGNVITRRQWLTTWLESRDIDKDGETLNADDENAPGPDSGSNIVPKSNGSSGSRCAEREQKRKPLKYIPHSLISFVDDASGEIVLKRENDAFEGGKEYRVVVKYRPELVEVRRKLLEIKSKLPTTNTDSREKLRSLVDQFGLSIKKFGEQYPEVGVGVTINNSEHWNCATLRTFFSELLWQEFHGGVEEFEQELLFWYCRTSVAVGFSQLCLSLVVAGLDARWLGLQTLNFRKVPTTVLGAGCSDGNFCAFAAALKENASIQNLDLSGHEHDIWSGLKRVTAFAEVLKKNSSIQNLNLSDTGIFDGGYGCVTPTILFDGLRENSSVQKLKLYGNAIGAVGATALAEALTENSLGCIQELDLGHQYSREQLRLMSRKSFTLGVEGVRSLAAAVGKNSTLKVLNLCQNGIGVEGVKALAEALKENSSIHKLDLSHNSIGGGGATALAEALRKNTSIQELNLAYCIPKVDAGEGWCQLATAVGISSSLKVVDLGDNFLQVERSSLKVVDLAENFLQALAKGLKENSTLQKLYLGYSGIEFRGTQALVSALSENSTMLSLSLRGCKIDAGWLIAGLRDNSSIQELDLADCSVGDEEARNLASVLRHDSSLRELNLAGNRIDQDGIQALFEALKVNTTLRSLDLSKNRAVHWQALAEALKVNSTLRVLNLTGSKYCKIESGDWQVLAAALKENSTFQELSLYAHSRDERKRLDGSYCEDAETAWTAVTKENPSDFRLERVYKRLTLRRAPERQNTTPK